MIRLLRPGHPLCFALSKRDKLRYALAQAQRLCLRCYTATRSVGCFCTSCAVKHREYNRAFMLKRRDAIRQELITAFGGACECCGETIPLFLTVDHVNNDGASETHRGVTFYRKVLREGCPKEKYRLLCFNCNCGRARNKGICPHVTNQSESRDE